MAKAESSYSNRSRKSTGNQEVKATVRCEQWLLLKKTSVDSALLAVLSGLVDIFTLNTHGTEGFPRETTCFNFTPNSL